MKRILCIVLLIAAGQLARAQAKQDTICGKLFSVKKISNTYYLLNLDGYYPHQRITIVLKGPQDQNELYDLKDSIICATGRLQDYYGKKQLVSKGRFRNIKK